MNGRVETGALLAGLGIAGILAGVLLVIAPGFAESLGVGAIASARSVSEASDRAFWLAALGVCCLLWVARTAGSKTETGDFGAVSRYPIDDGTVPTVGRGFDAAVEAAADAAAEGDDHDDAKETLRSLAADVLVHAEGCSHEAAAERVRRGDWTDDPVAAAYLAQGREAPFRWRLRTWFRPRRTTKRRIGRTVRAIEARMDGEGR
ncbi:hypothetical protein HWV23_11635 [Natronomonas halophila]|uniref:DUF7269 family protein n=1 Tax=Natronomonas halophila TaxID=2747817 RepID=UPI0015B5737A|nr:hypothetical protein [Natronomonas halophila]QLD86347.1 hypothetical protein HWV23_11635 [Natronomonas halophila]